MPLKGLKALQSPVFTTQQASEVHVSPRMLSYFVSKGLLKRLSYGVYLKTDHAPLFEFDLLLRKALLEVPHGVLGRRSALQYFGLTDESVSIIEMIVATNHIPRRKISDVAFFTAPPSSMTIGIQDVDGLRITNLDRTLVECLATGMSYAQVRLAFERAQDLRLRPSLTEMQRFANLLRAKTKFNILKGTIL